MKLKEYLGIGPLFTLFSLLYSLIVFSIYKMFFPDLKFTLFSEKVNFYLGLSLIIFGVFVFVISLVEAFIHFREEKLYTDGIYSIVRHPMYGSWIVMIVPGIVIISRSVLGLSLPIVMFFLFKWLISEEECCLEKKFGESYRIYKKRVGAIFPKIFF